MPAAEAGAAGRSPTTAEQQQGGSCSHDKGKEGGGSSREGGVGRRRAWGRHSRQMTNQRGGSGTVYVWTDSYSEGVASTSQQCAAWNASIASVAGRTCSSMTVFGSATSTRFECSDVLQFSQSGDASTGRECGGNTWLGSNNFGGNLKFIINTDCDGIMVRPCIVSQNWLGGRLGGGVQSMAVNAIMIAGQCAWDRPMLHIFIDRCHSLTPGCTGRDRWHRVS